MDQILPLRTTSVLTSLDGVFGIGNVEVYAFVLNTVRTNQNNAGLKT